MSKTLPICPVCAEGHLSSQIELLSVEHYGIISEIANHFSVCDVCETEQASANKMRLNKRAMIACLKEQDGL